MPTFYDPGADAGEASEALRGLAHASRNFENPQDLYGVLGDLLSGVRSLRQVLDQLATAHINNRARAFDDHGDHAVGSTDALAAADELHQAATFIDQAEERLNAAASAASRVAWHEAPAADLTPTTRWVNLIFMQGEDADEVLDMIDTDGATAGLDHLKNWDFGDETTSAAMENGYVYDEPPSGPLEHELREGTTTSPTVTASTTSPSIDSTPSTPKTDFRTSRAASMRAQRRGANSEHPGSSLRTSLHSSNSEGWGYEPG